TVSRVAAAPPLEGLARSIVEGVGRVGYFLVSPAFVLAACLALLSALGLGSAALRERRPFTFALGLFLALFFITATVHFLLEPGDWLNATLNLLSALAIWWVCLRFLALRGSGTGDRGSGTEVVGESDPRSPIPDPWPGAARVGVLMAAVAYTGNFAYVLEQLLGTGGRTSGNLGVAARDFGE